MMNTQIVGGHVAIVLAIALLIVLAVLLIHRVRARRKARQAPAPAPARHSRSGPVESSPFDHSAGRTYPASSSADDSFPTPAMLWSRTSAPEFTGGGGEFSGAGASGGWDSPSCSSSSDSGLSSSCSSSSSD